MTSSVADHIARKSGDCNMFMGEYNHTIDAKGRLIIPAKFRDALGESFVVTKGFDGCLFMYDKTEWAPFEQKLKALPLGNKEARNLVRFFLAGADEVELDKQGRILVAPPLREYAALEKDVTVIGVRTCRKDSQCHKHIILLNVFEGIQNGLAEGFLVCNHMVRRCYDHPCKRVPF